VSHFSFQTHPDQYKHFTLTVHGAVATLALGIQEDGGLHEGYTLKLNSYDLGVDIELADAVQRLRFEHPEVGCVVVTSALDSCFSSGANIFMLGSSTHAFKVNFCKYTNETRLTLEEASRESGQRYIAALNGVASGGGYELALACEEIYLVDDRKSAVSLPEVPYLGVLPGTGGITRVTDKRRVRRDYADIFLTLAEGIKGKRAKEWGLVDDVFRSSGFQEAIAKRAAALAAQDRSDRKGVALQPVTCDVSATQLRYEHVQLDLLDDRTATLTLIVPPSLPAIPANAADLGSGWWALHALRELDDALLRLRFHYPETGVIRLRTRGPKQVVLDLDAALLARQDDWFVREVTLHLKRVLKRVDLTAKTFFALIEPESCFVGSLFELALAADRSFMLDEDGVTIQLSGMNHGPLPMSNDLTRLASRFYGRPDHVAELVAETDAIDAAQANELGLVTFVYDDIDWEDDVRMAIEERASFSPDALTGMEANTRFTGPETMETKIFGRLSAWQNWIFQRPNAVGEKGALKLYGSPQSAEFDYRRT